MPDDPSIITRAKAGDESAVAVLYDKHFRTLHKVAIRRSTHPSENDDFFQLACLAFLEAIQKYRPDGGACFDTFLGHWVSGKLLTARKKVSLIHIPHYLFSRHRDTAAIERLLHIVSASEEMGNAGLNSGISETLADTFPDYRTDAPESRLDSLDTEAEHMADLTALDTAISKLPQRDRWILRRRLRGETMQSIADHFAMTRENVRQIGIKTIKKLRGVLAGSS